MNKPDFILTLYRDKRTVFRLSDVSMIFPDAVERFLSERMGYYLETGRLLRVRRGIYAKPDYNPLELANMLYRPSYISLEYVLQKTGIIFQYDTRYTNISYLSREISVDGKIYSYRRIKPSIIMASAGIIRNENLYSVATPERAFLDMLYLNQDYYFDNLHPIDRTLLKQILPIYRSPALERKVKTLFKK